MSNCEYCAKEGKSVRAVARSMCMKHFKRERRHGNAETVLTNKGEVPMCSNGCSRKASAHGLCVNCNMMRIKTERRAKGLCHQCGSTKEAEYARCSVCRAKHQVNKKRRRLG